MLAVRAGRGHQLHDSLIMANVAKQKGWRAKKPGKAKSGSAKKGRSYPARLFDDCGGKGCKVRAGGGYRLADEKTRVFKDFNYTTPSAINEASPLKPSTPTVRMEERGCKWKTVRVVGKKGKNKGKVSLKKVVTDKRPECQKSAPPCARAKNTKTGKVEPRKTCPVQLFWRYGKPFVRFCQTPNKPGFIKQVSSVEEAVKLSTKACQEWFDSGSTPATRKFGPAVNREGLGGTRKRRRRG